ncbi:MAG: amino acid permease [Methanosarcinales archaeon]|nr:amino acid permease [Methanosarcinales archaeon]
MVDEPALKRELGLLEVTLSGVGIILGAGIYALLGEAAALAGNAVWISFALAALVALLTGLSYAELSSMYPRASAEYEYTLQAFGRRTAFVIGWLIILSGIIGAATVSLGFAAYLQALTGLWEVPSALALLAVLSLILFVGIRESAWVAILFTLIEASGLVTVIALGLPRLGQVDYLETAQGTAGVFQAAALIFFAYQGFEEMVKLSEETREPEKTIPRALILAVCASIVLYIAVALTAVSVLGWQGLGQSPAPFADIARAAFGEQAFQVMGIIALFATSNTVLLMLLASSRITYGMASSGSLPHSLARVHPRTRTPGLAILAAAVFAGCFVFLEDIAFVANVTNFTLFLTFITINAALIFLRFRQPENPRPFRVPLNIGRLPLLPLAGMATCLFMISQLSLPVMALGVVLAVLGALISRWAVR